MIRPSDFANVASWARATSSSSWRVDTPAATNAGSSWFEGDAPGPTTSIAGDPSLASRGLSVEQHTACVLIHLLGERDARG